MNQNENIIKMYHRTAGMVVIDIEGVIGTPETWQFPSEDERVATYERFRTLLGEIRELRANHVRVNIRSRGGSVEDALLIYEALRSLENATIETICHGYVASAATIIAQAGDVRKVTSDTLYLVHQATMSVDGNAGEIEQASRLLSKTDERIAALYASRSGKSSEEFNSLMQMNAGAGEWLTPQEVLAAGLADEVVDISYLTRMGKKIRDWILPRNPRGFYSRSSQEWDVQNAAPAVEMPDAQAKALPTPTLAKEDPAVELLTNTFSANQMAYSQDIEAFRSTVV
ncbi:peptidase S14, ClpP [Mucinivorans hirudinis]|uniref:ATP-dependent Clp protease proteolytic subunit n=1 Tax=Mucinivorans hirudinis TaxID=1433126 RepID=A0A060R861_9BACT|nr:peptidase S14, ClpP [Mucinivorans hirudinis]